MKIGLITYDKPHFKSYQILKGLIKKNKYQIKLLLVKFKKRSKKKNDHRPHQFKTKSQIKLAKVNNIKSVYFNKKNCLSKIDVAIIGGANLLNYRIIKKNYILNCHSGLIPQTRGLDSIKWSIYKNELVGNTLHYIDQSVDKGNIVCHKITKVYKSDRLSNFYKRHYNNEIKLLINFENFLKKKMNKKNRIIKLRSKSPTLRMPEKFELKLKDKFEIYKKKFINYV